MVSLVVLGVHAIVGTIRIGCANACDSYDFNSICWPCGLVD